MSFLSALNPFSSIIGAAASLAGTRMNNLANAQQAANQNAFNAEQASITRDFNADQADQSRDWAADQAAITRSFNSDEADEARSFNSAEAVANRTFQSQEAEKNRAYQTEMANTSYQRGIADMKAAGINPMLAYMKGGAVAPSGSMASGSQASGSAASASAPSGASASASHASGHAAHFSDMLTPAVQSALQARKNSAEVELLHAQKLKVDAETRTESNRPENVAASTDNLRSGIGLNESRQWEIYNNVQKILQDTKLSKAQEGYYKDQSINLTEQNKLITQQIEQAIQQTRLLSASTQTEFARAFQLNRSGQLQEAETILKRLAQSEAEANSAFYSDTGEATKAVQMALQVLKLLGFKR